MSGSIYNLICRTSTEHLNDEQKADVAKIIEELLNSYEFKVKLLEILNSR